MEDLNFLRAHTSRSPVAVKITVPGPFTMSQQAQDDYYGNPESVALGYAEAVGEEVRDLFAAGADIVQLDEPYLQARPEPAKAPVGEDLRLKPAVLATEQAYITAAMTA